MNDHQLFPTFVVGSLPRPRWVRDVIENRRDGRLSAQEADRLLDSAIPSAVRMQERAGLTYVSDGEWRRESYIKVICEHVDGFKMEAVPSVSRVVMEPAVVSKLRQRGPLAVDAARFLVKATTRKTIVALPSPYILGWRMWHAELSRSAYPTRKEFMDACVPILRAEMRALAGAGVDHIQIDEPWLLMLVDPDHRRRIGATDVEKEIALCVEMVNAVAGAAGDVPTSMHLCHAHFNRQRFSEGGYEPIIEALGEINVTRFAMEFAAPQSHGVDVLARFPKGKILGLGVIDHCDSKVEDPETVVSRVEAALKYLPAERITLNPDCGFSPSTQNPMNFDEAYLKLTAMCRAAESLREKYGREG
ncbi:MAG: cobalamin-independent methionine synthase II family protein [Chloroflexi bacterium]|nr:cobalamin-independent methionine synthase II family protein [Chloroflexota bacterium]